MLNIRRVHLVFGTLLNAILAITIFMLLQRDFHGGFFFVLKIKFVLYLLLALAALHQLFLIFVLPRIRNIKEFYKNIALLAATCAATLIIAEIAARAAYPDSPVASYARCDQVFDHAYIPNGSGKYVNFAGEYQMDYSISSMGLRDKEYNKTKCANCYRIVMMGDSFTAGLGVQEEDTFQNLIEEKLNEKYNKEGKKIEIINMGIESNAQTIEYLSLKYKLLELNPDTVIVNFDITDPFQDADYLKKAIYSSNGELTAVDGCIGELDTQEKLLNIRLVNLASAFFDRMVILLDIKIPVDKNPAPDLLRITRPEYVNSDEVNAYWNTTFFYFDKIVNLTREKNAALIIITYPWGHQVNGDQWPEGRKAFGFEEGKTYSLDPQRRIMEYCKEKNLTCLDMTENFKNSSTTNYYKYDPHLTKDGNKLAADTIFRFLEDNDIIK